jgi:hypothetical protein
MTWFLLRREAGNFTAYGTEPLYPEGNTGRNSTSAHSVSRAGARWKKEARANRPGLK